MQPSSYVKDPRYSALKAQLIRQVHQDLPYAIRFLSRMDRLGQRTCAQQISAIAGDLSNVLLKEVGDIIHNRRHSSITA